MYTQHIPTGHICTKHTDTHTHTYPWAHLCTHNQPCNPHIHRACPHTHIHQIHSHTTTGDIHTHTKHMHIHGSYIRHSHTDIQMHVQGTSAHSHLHNFTHPQTMDTYACPNPQPQHLCATHTYSQTTHHTYTTPTHTDTQTRASRQR